MEPTPKFVITKYHASWCVPCRTLGTNLGFELTKRNSGHSFVLNEVNIEDSPAEAALAGVKAVPLVVIWDNELNCEVHRSIGGEKLPAIKEALDALGIV